MTGPDARDTREVRASFMPRRPAQVGRIESARNPRGAMARLWPYLAAYRVPLIASLTLVVLSTLLGLLSPYLLGVAIDRFIGGRDAAGLGRMALLMLGVYLATNALQAAANWVMADVSQRALQNLRRDLFNHLQTLPLRFFDRQPAGELMSRLTNDIDAINQAVSQNLTALLASVLSLVGILAAMFILNAWLALATLVVIPVTVGFTNFIARYTRRGFRDLQFELGRLTGAAEEAISGQKVVKAFRRSPSVAAAFHERNEAVFHAGVRANAYALLLMPISNVLGNFFIIVLAGLGGYLALQGRVTVGTIAAFISYGRNYVQPLQQLANMYNAIQAALAGAERVFEILDVPGEAQDLPQAEPMPPVKGHVSFEAVDFAYEPGTPIIKGMTLEAFPGQTLALVGPTGAGKTTIVNLLGRFYEIQGGHIRIDGRDTRDMHLADLRRSLGVVLQDNFLFADTVMENIRYGRLEASDDEVVQAARLAKADAFVRQLPQGYQTRLAERGANLSQGQRQMLGIARALLANPAILVLDEATSSVDTRTEARIQKALLELMKGRTAFVIAHRLSTIREADKVVVINNGEVVEQGTHQELLARRGFYHQLYMSQFKGLAI
jgi:ATP-binding cassette, subfamily B, multidrug efflux pump